VGFTLKVYFRGRDPTLRQPGFSRALTIPILAQISPFTVGSTRGAWAVRLCEPDWPWFPPAATSNRACGFPAHGSPTLFTVGIRVTGAKLGGVLARRRFR
jgi:hypothetical protein